MIQTSVPKTVVASIALNFYMKGGKVKGHDLDNWLSAEKVLVEMMNDASIEETTWSMELRT
jgi:hypothetical protein